MLHEDKINFLVCYGDTVGEFQNCICRASVDWSPEKVQIQFINKYGEELGIYSHDQILSVTQTGIDSENIYEL